MRSPAWQETSAQVRRREGRIGAFIRVVFEPSATAIRIFQVYLRLDSKDDLVAFILRTASDLRNRSVPSVAERSVTLPRVVDVERL